MYNFQPSISDCQISLDTFEANISYNDIRTELLCEPFTAIAKAWGKKQENDEVPCCDDWKIYYESGYHPWFKPEEQPGIEGSDETYLTVCDCRLVILPTYSNVDVRVMDIYDYPVSDPCERNCDIIHNDYT